MEEFLKGRPYRLFLIETKNGEVLPADGVELSSAVICGLQQNDFSSVSKDFNTTERWVRQFVSEKVRGSDFGDAKDNVSAFATEHMHLDPR